MGNPMPANWRSSRVEGCLLISMTATFRWSPKQPVKRDHGACNPRIRALAGVSGITRKVLGKRLERGPFRRRESIAQSSRNRKRSWAFGATASTPSSFVLEPLYRAGRMLARFVAGVGACTNVTRWDSTWGETVDAALFMVHFAVRCC